MSKKQLTESELTNLIYEATMTVLQEEEMQEWVKGAGLAANLGNAVGRGVENLKQFGRDFKTARASGKAAAQLNNMKKNVTSDLYGDKTPEINAQKGRALNYAQDRKNAVSADNQSKYGNRNNNGPQPMPGSTESQTAPQAAQQPKSSNVKNNDTPSAKQAFAAYNTLAQFQKQMQDLQPILQQQGIKYNQVESQISGLANILYNVQESKETDLTKIISESVNEAMKKILK